MEIDLWMVLLAAVVAMIIGAIWYSPALFGKAWMHYSGLSQSHMQDMKKKGMGARYLGGLVAALVVAYVLAYFAEFFQVRTFGEGFMMAFIGWLGFTAPELFHRVLWEDKPMKLFLINAAYWLVALGVMGGLLAELT